MNKQDSNSTNEDRVKILEAQVMEYREQINSLWEARIKRSEDMYKTLEEIRAHYEGIIADLKRKGHQEPLRARSELRVGDLPQGLSYPARANESTPIALIYLREGIL